MDLRFQLEDTIFMHKIGNVKNREGENQVLCIIFTSAEMSIKQDELWSSLIGIQMQFILSCSTEMNPLREWILGYIQGYGRRVSVSVPQKS